jgi:ArsR family transcriptional regulator, arsenate/arsenite/antimonite-responsive transcriptional repressor
VSEKTPARDTDCACGPAITAAGKRVVAEEPELDAVFKALASAQRRELLRIVAASTSQDGACCETEVCACKLADALELAPSTISHHMGALVKAGLVTASKRGLWVYYRLERDALARAAGALSGL